MTLYRWSQVAASDATADSTINWQEGQAPSSVNDSARAMMAATAKFRDDTNGALTTAGTTTAFTITSNQNFDTLAHLDKQTLTITMNATSGATPTLNVDSLGAKPIRIATGATLATGALISGSTYSVTYYNTAGEFLIHDQLAAQPLSANSVTTSNITDANVTYAKIQNVAASRLLGNPTGSGAAPAEIPIGAGLAFSGGALVGSPVSGPIAGATGLVIVNDAGTSNTLIDVSADQVTLLNSTGVPIYASGVSVQINTSTVGANGMDAGTRPTSGWLYVYLISDGTNIRGLASLSATAPTMPSGFTYAGRFGAMITDSSQNLMKTRQNGSQAQYSIQAGSNTTIFPAIVPTSAATVALWGVKATGAFIPPTSTEISMICYGDTTSGQVGVSPNGNATTAAQAFFYATTNTATGGTVRMVLESQNIYYTASGGGINGYHVWVAGWKDKVNAT